MINVLLIANVILVALLIRFVFKQLIVNYRFSRSQLKNVFIVLLTLVSICSIYLGLTTSVSTSFEEDLLESQLKRPWNTVDENGKLITIPVEERRAEIESMKSNAAKYSIISCLMYGTLIILHKSIALEVLESRPTGKWDSNKL